jgi:3-oxoacyl-[acyl-carrier-protein] synthase III
MPAKISRASVCNLPDLGSVAYSAHAGKECVETSALEASDVGLLLNIGVYRDKNLHEPALASLIQGQMGLNNSPVTGKGRDGQLGAHTFAFDLINGSCGFFNAIQVAESFIATGTTTAALIVASDVHPSNRPNMDFPYAHLGAAMLLTSSRSGSGFRNVVHKTSKDDYVGRLSYVDLDEAGAGGRDVLTMEVDDAYATRLKEFAAASLREYLEQEDIDVDRIKYVVAPRHPSDMHPTIVEVLGIAEERLIDVDTRFGHTFTSLPIVGYHLAEEAGLSEGESVLFVGVGAGLTFGCGLYVA